MSIRACDIIPPIMSVKLFPELVSARVFVFGHFVTHRLVPELKVAMSGY